MTKMIIQFSGKAADKKEFRYAGRNLRAGDEFETTSDKDTKILQVFGIAVPATESRKGVSLPPLRRGRPPKARTAPAQPEPAAPVEQPTQEAPAVDPEAPPEAQPSQELDPSYRRRDLRAED